MMLALAAIEQAGARGDDRAAVVRAFFGLRRRDSVLGPYAIDGHGDTTLRDYGGYRVIGGELAFDQVIRAGR
jgi:branched-chain amino acid transport system substrate-binding protein